MNNFNDMFDVEPINTPSIPDLVNDNKDELLSMVSFKNECYVSSVDITLHAQLRFKDPDLNEYVCEVKMSAIEDDYDFGYYQRKARDYLGEMEVVDILKIEKEEGCDTLAESMTEEQQEAASLAIRMKLMMKLSA